MRAVCCLVALVSLLGCGTDDSTAPRTLPGKYPLVSFGGNPLPTTYYEEPDLSLTMKSGEIELLADGTFAAVYVIRVIQNGNWDGATVDCTGTWTSSGRSLTFVEVWDRCGGGATGTWDGDNTLAFTWADGDAQAVHQR